MPALKPLFCWSATMYTIFLFLNRLYFFEQFEFTTKLSWRYRDFWCTPWPNTCTASLISIPQQSGTFTITEPASTYHYHPNSIFTLGFIWYCTCTGLDKCVMTCIHHCTIIQNRSTTLKFLHAHLFIPSPTPISNNHLPF